MAARTYKRDSIGRFASSSGGGSTGKPAAKKTAASKPAAKKPAAKKPAAGKTAAKKPAASKPASNGRRGPRGGKVGTKAQQAKAKREQQARSKQFASKKQATSAQKAWKAASRGARMSEKGAAKKVGRPRAKAAARPVNTSGPAFSRRMARAESAAASQRRMQAEMARPMQFSGRKPGGAADTRFREQLATASYNRQNRSQAIAREAKKVLALAAQSPSDWKSRPRFSTVRNPSKSNVAWSYSDLSAWGSPKKRARRK